MLDSYTSKFSRQKSMLKRKKKRHKDRGNSEKSENISNKVNTNLQQSNLVEQIKNYAAGLCYISETDAEILPFTGEETESVSSNVILTQTKNDFDSPIEENHFAEFFARLTEIQDWFGDEEKKAAERYLLLKELLEKNLRNLKVFKVGKIQLDIYVVGLDAENRLLGIKTKAVET